MVLLPPAGTTWHRHSSISTARGQWALCEATPGSAPTHHLLGADPVQVVRGHSVVPLQDDRDDLCVTGTALHLSRCHRDSHRLKAHLAIPGPPAHPGPSSHRLGSFMAGH